MEKKINQVVEEWNKKMDIQYVANMFQITTDSVYSYLSKARKQGTYVRNRKSDIEKEIIKQWNNGKSKKKICDEFNITKRQLDYILGKARKRGIFVKEKVKQTSQEKVVERWLKDKDVEKTAKELGLCKHTVQCYLSKFRAESRKEGQEKGKEDRKVNNYAKELKKLKLIVEDYINGLTKEQILRKYKLDLPTVEDYLIIADRIVKNNSEQGKNREMYSNLEGDILGELEIRLPRNCANFLKIEPKIVYDLLDSLSSQEKNSLKRLFIQSKRKVYKKIVRLKKEGFNSGEALFKLEYSLENDLKPDLAEIYFILGNGDRALNVLNGIIYDEDANETIKKRAKEKKDEIELELKSMEIRRAYKTQKNMDGSEITYDDLCRRYKVRTSFIVQLLGKRERDY